MSTEPIGGAKATNLSDEILKLNEIAETLKTRLLNRFVKTKEEEATKGEGVDPNPIDYLIKKTVDTQMILKGCLEILELEILSKLEGGN